MHGGRLSGVFAVDDDLLDAMTEMNAAAPAHNPPYIAAMKALRTRFPELPLVAAFELTFTAPSRRQGVNMPFPDNGRMNSTFANMDFMGPA